MTISQEAARFGLLRSISIQLDQAGFTHLEHRSLLEDLEALVVGLLDGVIRLAYETAQHSRRLRPNVRDMLAACADQGIELHHLNDILSTTTLPPPYELTFEIPVTKSIDSTDPTLEFLPSEDSDSDPEEDPSGDTPMRNLDEPIPSKPHPHKRRRLNTEIIGGLSHLPQLPAKHTWKYTLLKPPPATILPPSHPTGGSSISTPPTRASLDDESLDIDEADPNMPACMSSLNRRIRDTRLVERSLTNLIPPNSILPVKSHITQPSFGSQASSSAPKVEVSENDIPIINFERDWYSTHQTSQP